MPSKRKLVAYPEQLQHLGMSGTIGGKSLIVDALCTFPGMIPGKVPEASKDMTNAAGMV